MSSGRTDVAHEAPVTAARDDGSTNFDGHALVLIRDEQRKRGWHLAWHCQRPDCDTKGDSTTPRRDIGVRLFDLLNDAHQKMEEGQ